MSLTLNIDPPRVKALKRHAGARGLSASRLVTEFIDGLAVGRPPPPLGKVIGLLRTNRAMLADRGLLNVAVFGSVARGEECPGSDIDLLVKPNGQMTAFRLAGVQSALRDLLEAPVEIVTLDEFGRGFDRSNQEDVVVAY